MVGDIFQPTHLLFVLVVALLVLGPKRLPEVGRTLGSGIRDFRQALSGESSDHTPQPNASDADELSPQWDPAEDHTDWPEEAIGPTSFDEPIEAASAEPTAGAGRPGSAAPTPPVDHGASAEPTAPAEHAAPDSRAVATSVASEPIQAAPERDLAASERELAEQTEHTHRRAEGTGSPEQAD